MDHDRSLPASRLAGNGPSRRPAPPGLLLMLALAAAGGAQSSASAASIYRCGNSFSQVPCPQATVVELRGDTPSAADMRATRQAVERDAALAADLAREREQRERHAARQGAASLGGAPRQEEVSTQPTARKASGRAHKRGARTPSDDFTAVVPGTRPKRSGN